MSVASPVTRLIKGMRQEFPDDIAEDVLLRLKNETIRNQVSEKLFDLEGRLIRIDRFSFDKFFAYLVEKTVTLEHLLMSLSGRSAYRGLMFLRKEASSKSLQWDCSFIPNKMPSECLLSTKKLWATDAEGPDSDLYDRFWEAMIHKCGIFKRPFWLTLLDKLTTERRTNWIEEDFINERGWGVDKFLQNHAGKSRLTVEEIGECMQKVPELESIGKRLVAAALVLNSHEDYAPY